MNELLHISNLGAFYQSRSQRVQVLDDIDFKISAGEAVGLVGESGCGKSSLALSLLDLGPHLTPESRLVFQGQQLSKQNRSFWHSLRGKKISLVSQEALMALDPLHKVGMQIAEMFIVHKSMNFKDAKLASIRLMNLVKIPDAARRFEAYPHELSGGLRQRIVIAMALACNPDLLIADEPTTALDVTVQAEILDLIKDLRQEFSMAMLLVTHDLGVVAETCDRVIVMYEGKIVEDGPVVSVLKEPKHPYTQKLISSLLTMKDRKAS